MQTVGTKCLPLPNTAGAGGHQDDWRMVPLHSDPGKETTLSPREDRALGIKITVLHPSRRQTPSSLVAPGQSPACSQGGALSPGQLRVPEGGCMELLEVCSRNQDGNLNQGMGQFKGKMEIENVE